VPQGWALDAAFVDQGRTKTFGADSTRKWRPGTAGVGTGRRADERDLQPTPGSQLLLHVNGFGGTPLMERYLLYHCTSQLLKAQGLQVARSLVGNYTTALEMAGGSLTVTVLDEELKSLWDGPVHSAGPGLRPCFGRWSIREPFRSL
jgi:dihydroxyacetone kinase